MTADEHITAEAARALLDYDPFTGVFRWKWHWKPTHIGRVLGSGCSTSHATIRVGDTIHKAHRLAWLIMTGSWPSRQVDHRNGCPADNRWGNLRLATNAENVDNSPRRKNNRSGFKGVHAYHSKWKAQIGHRGKVIYLGLFDTPEEAHQAYCDAADRLKGEFARHS